MKRARHYIYTAGDVAALANVQTRTVNKLAREGKLDLRSLLSVTRYVISKRRNLAVPPRQPQKTP